MENKKTVSVNLVVLNGEKYIRHFLDSLERQTYPRDKIQFNILDNGSTDKTKTIIGNWKMSRLCRGSSMQSGEIGNSSFAAFNFIESKQNLGMWPGQEKLLNLSKGEVIIATAVDIILDKDLVSKSVKKMNSDSRIGAIQAKIYRYDLSSNGYIISPIIDTCGFEIFKSRRVINIGHGEPDSELYSKEKEVFAVEGAIPILRRKAMENAVVNGEFADKDYFWYGDDLDFAWRMRLFGWKEIFCPDIIAWHDRQTTKSVKKNWKDYFLRLKIRENIPIRKRRLDWRNVRFTIIKNDYIINILKDLPFIAVREVMVLGYTILFEPQVLNEYFKFFGALPGLLRKRKLVMQKAKLSAGEMRKWFE